MIKRIFNILLLTGLCRGAFGLINVLQARYVVGATPQLELVWPELKVMNENDQLVLTSAASKCDLFDAKHSDEASIVACLRSGAHALDEDDPNMLTTNRLEHLLRQRHAPGAVGSVPPTSTAASQGDSP